MNIMLTLPAEIRYVRLASLTAWKVAELFADTLNAKESAAEFSHAFELSISEAFTNAVRYAEPPAEEKKVTISFSSDTTKLTACVIDTNPPFSIETLEPEISSYPEKGFGLLLIRRFMDSVSYKREKGSNLISMTKQPDTANKTRE